MADVWITSSYLPAGASKFLPGSPALLVLALPTCTPVTAGTASGLVKILGSGLYGEILIGPALTGGLMAGAAGSAELGRAAGGWSSRFGFSQGLTSV